MHETNRLLLDEIPGKLSSRQKRLVELNLESGERLSEMITKLLDFARMDEDAISYERTPQNLVNITSRAVEAFSARVSRAVIPALVWVELRASPPRGRRTATAPGPPVSSSSRGWSSPWESTARPFSS